MWNWELTDFQRACPGVQSHPQQVGFQLLPVLINIYFCQLLYFSHSNGHVVGLVLTAFL